MSIVWTGEKWAKIGIQFKYYSCCIQILQLLHSNITIVAKPIVLRNFIRGYTIPMKPLLTLIALDHKTSIFYNTTANAYYF